MKTFQHELKHAVRGVASQPGFSLPVIGVLAASSLLYDVPASNPLTLISVAALLLGTLTLACSQPTWRACRIAPREALS